MGRTDDRDQIPAEEAKSAHTMEPAEGAREPGKDATAQRPPHPVEPAEGPRRPDDDDEESPPRSRAGGAKPQE